MTKLVSLDMPPSILTIVKARPRLYIGSKCTIHFTKVGGLVFCPPLLLQLNLLLLGTTHPPLIYRPVAFYRSKKSFTFFLAEEYLLLATMRFSLR